MDRVKSASFEPWTPIFVRTSGGMGTIDWAVVDEPFAHSFFEDTATRAMRRPFNRCFLRSSPLDALEAVDACDPGLEPSGFVFHMSRCGSTLAAQLLASAGGSIVLSEAQPIDAILRLRGIDGGPDDATIARTLRAAIRVLARPRAGERRSFVKFQAWHAIHLPFIASVYPDVPWVFIFREPRAVLRSHQRSAGAEFVPGTIDPAYVGLDLIAATALPFLDYGARVLGTICDAAFASRDLGRSAFVDYADVPKALIDRVFPSFGIRPSADDLARIASVAELDAKAGGTVVFTAVCDERASPEIERAAERWLDAPFEKLRIRAEVTR